MYIYIGMMMRSPFLPGQSISPTVDDPSVSPGCRVQGTGCRVQGAGCRVHDSGCWVLGAGFSQSINPTVDEPSVSSGLFGRRLAWASQVVNDRAPNTKHPPPLGQSISSTVDDPSVSPVLRFTGDGCVMVYGRWLYGFLLYGLWVVA